MPKPFARLAGAFAVLALFAPLPAFAEFLDPDWSDLTIEGVAAPDWLAGVNDGDYIGMCSGCDETLMLQVQARPDDGTGGRVHSGETTAETWTEIGQANAAQLGNVAEYYGTETLDFASAKGFKTSAKGATGDFSATYQLWDDGHQLIVRVYGADQEQVDSLAQTAFKAAAPLAFQ
ncbi:MAG: hypothetical protein P0Y65_02350 [Candidatus Devosia phytovorans]|uniref:Uncharacterized protein n=1 Tax=Candidatus Devosia phytovorans TaxID=3121372 RepID=A0AAJ5VWC0_9HYPH|nr:hypothetical protein [Devosia sp.]WEK05115.1 MAG: hypothetical protein P0Y65_02350 [Devosia sp.]